MKALVCFCYLMVYAIYTTPAKAYPKSLYENNFSSRDDDSLRQYPAKRKVPNQEAPYFVPANEQPNAQYSLDLSQLPRYRRVEEPLSNKQQLVGNFDPKQAEGIAKQLDLKRLSLGIGKRSDRLYKRDLRSQRHDDPYGVVYGNGRPIGVLELFPQSYEFSPLVNTREGIEEIEPLSQINPRRSTMDMLYPSDDRIVSNSFANGNWENGESNLQNSAKFADDKFPSVLNDFKIDARLNNPSFKRDSKDTEKESKVEETQESTASKREAKGLDNLKAHNDVKRGTITNEKIAELKSALSRMQNPGPSDKIAEIEDNLRDILNDMGLVDSGESKGSIDDLKSKRETNSEGAEAGFIKRETDTEDEDLEEGRNKIELVKATRDTINNNERNKRDDKADKELNIDNSQSKLNEEADSASNLEAREVKAEDMSSLKAQNEDLSNSNKRDTAKAVNVANYQAEGEAYIRSKRQEDKVEGGDIVKGLEKSGELTVSGNKSPLACSGNDMEVENKRNKDQSTIPTVSTDKAKREQDELAYQKQIEKNIQSKIDEIKEQVKREIEALKAKEASIKVDSQRKKRAVVNTLIEEENSALDPRTHPDAILTPHIRKRRNLENSRLKIQKRVKRGLPDFSNLRNIDTGDYLDLTSDKEQRGERQTLNNYFADQTNYNGALKEKRDTNAAADDVSRLFDANNVNYLKTEEDTLKDSNQVLEKKSVPLERAGTDQEKALEGALSLKNEDNAEVQTSDGKNSLDSLQKQDEDIGKRNTKNESSKTSDQKVKHDTNKRNTEEISESNYNSEEENSDNGLESERKRRQVEEELLQIQQNPLVNYSRRKRANAVIPYAKSAFFPYRSESEDGDDEGDEFEDDGFEDRAALQKRDVSFNPNRARVSADYQPIQDYDYSLSSNYVPEQKRSLASKYVAGMNPDVYENPANYLYARKKRQDFNVAALHGGGPMLQHLAAVRERNLQSADDSTRSKRNFHRSGQNSGNQNSKDQPENIADLSDTDLFGALPQSYDGSNLLRFKRVKRGLSKDNEVTTQSGVESNITNSLST